MSQPDEPLLCGWTLPSIIAEICERAGVPFDRIDVGQLDGYIDGFSTSNAHSAASAIEDLAGVLPFDPANYGGKINFIPRGGNVVASLRRDELVDDGKDTERLSRGDSITIPRVVNLEYYDTDGGLTTDKQVSDRSIDNRSKAESSTQTTIIMRANDAARAVVIGHKISIEEQRGEVEFSLGDNWLELVTSDVILLDGDRLRITDIEIDDGQQHYKATYDRASAYVTSIKGVPAAVPPDPPSLVVSESVMEFIDSHIVRSSDDDLGYYIAVTGLTANWTGAVVELSKDGGQNWIDGAGISAPAIMGKLASGCSSHSSAYRDDRNVITVELLRDDMELIAATQTEMQNRINLALVGDELINFSAVEQIGETTWELGGLLRGRKGTAPVEHLPGERFVLMDRSRLAFVEAELFELGRPLTFRVTSYGLTSGPTMTVTFAGESQQEREPAYLKARRVGAELQLSWQGVGRTGGGASVGMGRYFTGYRVSLGSNTYETTNLSLNIPYDSGDVIVRQINSITGEGPAITVTV